MAVTNTLAYCDTATITAIKSFIVQTHGCFSIIISFDFLAPNLLVKKHFADRHFTNGKETIGLYYKCFTNIIYDCNDSG
jgi:hypothetical protein